MKKNIKNKTNTKLIQHKSLNKTQSSILAIFGNFYLSATLLDEPCRIYNEMTNGGKLFVDMFNSIIYLITLPF